MLVGIAQELGLGVHALQVNVVSIRVLVGIAQELGVPASFPNSAIKFQSVC